MSCKRRDRSAVHLIFAATRTVSGLVAAADRLRLIHSSIIGQARTRVTDLGVTPRPILLLFLHLLPRGRSPILRRPRASIAFFFEQNDWR